MGSFGLNDESKKQEADYLGLWVTIRIKQAGGKPEVPMHALVHRLRSGLQTASFRRIVGLL